MLVLIQLKASLFEICQTTLTDIRCKNFVAKISAFEALINDCDNPLDLRADVLEWLDAFAPYQRFHFNTQQRFREAVNAVLARPHFSEARLMSVCLKSYQTTIELLHIEKAGLTEKVAELTNQVTTLKRQDVRRQLALQAKEIEALEAENDTLHDKLEAWESTEDVLTQRPSTKSLPVTAPGVSTITIKR